jgi:hypothetical protein
VANAQPGELPGSFSTIQSPQLASESCNAIRKYGVNLARDKPSVTVTTLENMILERRQIAVDASPDAVFRAFSSLGGRTGWLYMNWAWRVRGALDRLFGGVGMRKGRRDPEIVQVGDTIDFWLVVAVDPGQLIRLRAEMKLPGQAWLQFEVKQNEKDRSLLTQTTYFAPRGLFGLLYWHASYPLHTLIFGGMIHKIASRAETFSQSC